ncbi:MAG TPA: porin family protein [Chitinophagaceae bacterium]
MKKLLLVLAFIGTGYVLYAQDSVPAVKSTASGLTKYSRDYVMLQVGYDGWAGKPANVKVGGLSRGFNFALMYDFPVNKSHLSLGAGLGISTSGMFFNKQRVGISDSTTQLQFPADSTFKRFKLATTFLELPLELRFRQYENNANRGFKAAIGVKFGTLLNAHTKETGAAAGYKMTEKISSKRFFNSYRIAATARVGWGNLSLYGTYSLTPLLKQGAGPAINPYSIGLCLSGL